MLGGISRWRWVGRPIELVLGVLRFGLGVRLDRVRNYELDEAPPPDLAGLEL